jgi:hypothetical protein
VDLASYVGQRILVNFLVHQDEFGALTGMFVDDVQLTLPCGSISPTPTPTPAPRATPRAEVAPDTDSATLARLGTVKAGARERIRGLPICAGLPIRKALCFA